MKDSKFGLHFQRIPSWAEALVATMGLEWVKIVDPPDVNPFPGKNVIGRIYHSEGEDNKLILQGKRGAEEYFRQCVPTYGGRPYVTVWEGPNEPPVGVQEQRAKLSEFSLRWIELMHGEGLKVAALSLSVGWPQIGTAHEFADVAIATDYLSLHEYSAPRMQDGESWYCLRYRRTVRELSDVGVAPPQIFITEAGIDGGCEGRGGKGWRSYTDRLGYFEQLLWYNDELRKDSYVVAFTPFTSGPYSDWEDFNFDEGLVKLLAGHLKLVPDLPITPAPPVKAIRQACWDQQNVPYNPAAALQRAAEDNYLGAPLSPEFDKDGYRIQAYAEGIVYCRIGHWHDVRYMGWHKNGLV